MRIGRRRRRRRRDSGLFPPRLLRIFISRRRDTRDENVGDRSPRAVRHRYLLADTGIRASSSTADDE